MVAIAEWKRLVDDFTNKGVTLVAVSKTKPNEAVQELYEAGQRDFGENYVQELVDKHTALPKDIKWHFIGHLQGNKVKYIAPFVHLIHAIDSFKLLQEVNKYAQKNERVIDVLLQLYIANEETKFGMDEAELDLLLENYTGQIPQMQNIRICGLMGMATNTNNQDQVKKEFAKMHQVFTRLSTTIFADKPYFKICSMGMSADYQLAIGEGGNMVRIGSLLFGSRKAK